MSDDTSSTESSALLARPPSGLPRGLNILALAASAIIVVAGLRSFASSLGPVFLALILIVIVRPVQAAVVDRGFPTWAGLLALIASAYGILVVVFGSLAWAAAQLVDYVRGSDYEQQLSATQENATELLDEFGVSGDDLQNALDAFDIASVAGQVASALSGVAGLMSLLSLLVITMLFMAMDAGPFVRALNQSVIRTRPDITETLNRFAKATRSYFFVSTLFGLVVAVLDVVALLILGVPLAIAWGVLSLITNYIPNVGFVLGLVPPALVAFLEGGWQLAAIVVIVYLVINIVIQTIIQPKIVGDQLGLSATLTFFSLVFWAWVFGAIGALLAVPMTLLVKALLIDIDPLARWAGPLISLAPDASGAEHDDDREDQDVLPGPEPTT